MRLMPLVLTAAALAAALPAAAQEKIKLRVMGMPLSTGMIHKNKEQPFFETLAAKTGLPLDVDYKPLDSTGVKEFEQLRVMKTGIYDIVGLRMGQVSRDEPTILGLDLVGLNTDYKTAKKVVVMEEGVDCLGLHVTAALSPIPVARMCVPNDPVSQACVNHQRQFCGLTAEALTEKLTEDNA